MKNIITAVGALALTTTVAQAGGFDRSGQPIAWLFEKGTYAELTYGSVQPSVTGTQLVALSATSPAGSSSGNMAKPYSQVGLAFKMDLNEQLSLGLAIDQTYGADVGYPGGTGYFLAGTSAEIDGDTTTLAARYKLNDKISVHAGLRHVGIGGNVLIFNDGAPVYQASYGRDEALGYTVGAAYEKPEIALRVALTYNSATKHSMVTTVGGAPAGSVNVELPQSLALDFQTGVAANTLVFGQIRWSDWTSTQLVSPGLPAASNPLIGYANDTVSYSLGVGRKFNDTWSGAITLGYEEAQGGIASNFAPTDGTFSVGLGATYTQDNMKITGGVRYVTVGDARALGGAASFAGNHAVGFGLKVGFTF